jgi:hypothetical protein
VIEDDDRDFGHPEVPGGSQARVPCNDDSVRADQDRIRESELGDRRSYLRDLFLGMRPRISDVRNQAVDLAALHDEIAQNTLRHY